MQLYSRMKHIAGLTLLLLQGLLAHAQYPKYVITFRNKGNTPYTFSNPQAYLSQRAIDRRTRYSIGVDSSDLPVLQQYINTVAAQGAVTVLSRSKWLNSILIYTTDNAALARISALPFVQGSATVGNRAMLQDTGRNKFRETADPVNTVAGRGTNTTADYYSYGNSYGQVHIHNGEYLHNRNFRGQGMMVAVIDAGFNQYKTTPALDSVRNGGQVLGERDFVDFDNSVNEDDSHGRNCFSIMAANSPNQMVGTAPKANYWLLRSENALSEFPVEEFNWVAAAEFADSCGVDLISSSLGYSTFDDPAFDHPYSQFYTNSTMVSKGAAAAVRKGILVTNSAGNEGSNSWKYIIFPADADSVCTVAATDLNKNIAGFSSYGYPGKIKPNVSSVGVATLYATPGGIFSGNGTSYSNPNIAGLIACLWQAFPRFNNIKILDAVYRSSDRYTAPTDRFGYGIPDMKAAYRLLKHDENVLLYGNDWLWAEPDPFTDSIHVRFLGRTDGLALLQVFDSQGVLVAFQNNIATELEEVYNFTFRGLQNLPAGTYTLRYTDAGGNNRTVLLHKLSGGSQVQGLTVYPVPFSAFLNANFLAYETGKVSFSLLNSAGALVIETQEMNVTAGNRYTIRFKSVLSLPAGVYFLRYQGPSTVQTVRVLK